MKTLLIDENGEYGLDCTQAVWASDKMHEDYHRAKVQLSDADFLLDIANNIMILVYKNSDTKKANGLSIGYNLFNCFFFSSSELL